jgi:hypothetical protein
MDKKLEEIEKKVAEIEKEKNFDRVVEVFSELAVLVKDVMREGKEQRGRVMEIIKDVEQVMKEFEEC